MFCMDRLVPGLVLYQHLAHVVTDYSSILVQNLFTL